MTLFTRYHRIAFSLSKEVMYIYALFMHFLIFPLCHFEAGGNYGSQLHLLITAAAALGCFC